MHFPGGSLGSTGGSGINTECPTDSFRCNNGKCISHHWVCNYQKDCDDGEDEMQSCRKY